MIQCSLRISSDSLLSAEILKRVPTMLADCGKALSLAKTELKLLGPDTVKNRNLGTEYHFIIHVSTDPRDCE